MKKIIYYLTPVLLAVFMVTSNFLSTDIFDIGFEKFTVWFVLSVFSFACGWLIDQTLGWVKGGKILFAVIVVTSFFSVLLVLFFREYFVLSDLLSETLILYSLRNIMLGCMGFFGMSVSRVFNYERQLEGSKQLLENLEEKLPIAEKEAELILEKAKLESEKIMFDAESKSKVIVETKNRINHQLAEFIIAEEELLKQYESNEE